MIAIVKIKYMIKNGMNAIEWKNGMNAKASQYNVNFARYRLLMIYNALWTT